MRRFWSTCSALLLALLVMPPAAHAAWREASSKHFLVYSDGSEVRLRAYTAKLERFDHVLRKVTGTKQAASPTKLKVYLMGSTLDVQDTLPAGAGGGVGGYYEARARGPIAVVPGVREDIYVSGEMETLFHEYVHHFMFQYFPATYPTWYSEGFAEYYGTTEINEDGSVLVGVPARARYYSFAGNRWLPLAKILGARNYGDLGYDLHLLYAQGWLLVHYLAFNEERSGQLQKYLNAINAGQSYEAAMNAAFGPGATKLSTELFNYANKRKISATRLPFPPIDPGAISVRTLPPAENALIGYDIRLARGITKREAAGFAGKLRDATKPFASDPYALELLVEAERAADNREAAAAAAERLLAAKPRHARGLMHKAELQVEVLKAAGSKDAAAWNDARELILQANKAAPRDPAILLAYHQSFASEGVLPPPGAQNALFKANDLVPQDEELRYLLARDFEQRGMIDDAIATIRPIAFSLHDAASDDPRRKKRREKAEERYRLAGTEKRETAREMLARLESKRTAAAPASNTR